MGLNISGSDLALLYERRLLTDKDIKEIISKGLNPGSYLVLEPIPERTDRVIIHDRTCGGHTC